MPKPENKLLTRRGSFRITDDCFELDPDAVFLLMARCLVTRCEFRYDTRTFEYVALSPDFEPVGNAFAPPEYEAQFSRHNVGTEEAPIYETRFDGFKKAE